MTLRDILTAKGSTVYTIRPDRTGAEVVERLIEHGIGSLVVCESDEAGEDRLIGIVTDRDLFLAHAGKKCHGSHKTTAGQCPWMSCTVAELMTAPAITASPEDSVELVMGLMTTKRIRHLPVVAEGRMLGLVSIGDVVKAQHDHLAMENRYMKDYIRG